jgi:hypothetical protein
VFRSVTAHKSTAAYSDIARPGFEAAFSTSREAGQVKRFAQNIRHPHDKGEARVAAKTDRNAVKS